MSLKAVLHFFLLRLPKRFLPGRLKAMFKRLVSYYARFETHAVVRKVKRSQKPVIFGPWLSEVGFEVLYWIPFLKWFCQKANLPEDRVIVVSRGGSESWYRHLTHQYVDYFDYLKIGDFHSDYIKRVKWNRGQKHTTISDRDKALIQLIAQRRELKDYHWVHPLQMYQLFHHYWVYTSSIRLIAKYTQFETFQEVPLHLDLSWLPENFVAVKFYFSPSFPKTEENLQFVHRLLEELTDRGPVVYLKTGLEFDDHSEVPLTPELQSRVITLEGRVTPRNNLAVQTEVVRRATLNLGTYGGFSYLAPFYEKPSISFYSHAYKFSPNHLDVAFRAVRYLKYGTFHFAKTQVKDFGQCENSEFLVVHTKQFDVLSSVFLNEKAYDRSRART